MAILLPIVMTIPFTSCHGNTITSHGDTSTSCHSNTITGHHGNTITGRIIGMY